MPLPKISALSLACLVLCLAGLSRSAAAALKIGDPFPDLAVFHLEGQLPSAWQNKIVLVDFWASWCGPCKASFPAMQELHQRYAAQGLVILAVNVDEDSAAMKEFLKKQNPSFTVLRDAGQKLVARAGVAAMPTSFLLDRTRRIRFVHTGYRGAETQKKYQQEIEILLKE